MHAVIDKRIKDAEIIDDFSVFVCAGKFFTEAFLALKLDRCREWWYNLNARRKEIRN